MPEETKPIEAEVIEEMQVGRPLQPFTVTDLAASEKGVEIMERKLQVLKTLRRASIALTFPQDWVLFKAEDRITGFLSDQGCDRVKDMWGIEITGITEVEKVEDPADTDGVFAYRVSGEGHSKVTGQNVERMTGMRYSDEDFIVSRKLKPIKLDNEVRKAARANLDGSILRELAGLKAVPVEEMSEVWQGTWKRTELCPRGRGFGTADERAGGASSKHGIDAADIPPCEVCDKKGVLIKLVFRPGKNDREGFFGCPNWEKHKNEKMIIPLSKLKAIIEERSKRAAAAREPGAEG